MKNFVYDRVYWREIEGKNILFADYRNTCDEELFDVMREHVNTCINFAKKFKEPLLTLSMFKNNPVPEYYTFKAHKITMPSANLNKISVVTGLTSYQKFLLKVGNVKRENKLIHCDTIDHGINYILEKAGVSVFN